MAKTLFMIHGMWGGSWVWENYRRVFEEGGYSCITPTLRHHHMNPLDTPDPELGVTSLLDYVADLEAEIEQVGIAPIVIGHSMGGLLAQILASRRTLRGLVLLTPSSPAGINALTPSVVRSFWSVQSRWGFWKKPMRQTFGEAVYSMLHELPPDEQKETYNRFVYESGRAATEIGYWFFDLKRASRVDQTKVTCPTLVVACKKDRVTPASVVRKVADKYKAVSAYEEFPDHGHWVVGGPGWQEIAEYVRGWLDRVPA